MFSRKNRAERTAAQAWDYLSAAMATAGESARAARESARDAGKHTVGVAGKKGSKLADKATTKVNSAADEAWARANAAANALAGRKPGRPWGVIAGASLVGIALGWVAATTARAALERQAENEELELAETAVVVTPTYEN